MNSHTLAYIGFSLVKGLGPVRAHRLVEYFGDAASAWDARAGDLMAAGLEARLIEPLLALHGSGQIERTVQALELAGASALTWDDDEYPSQLREISSAPPLLYILGQFTPADSWAVAVVGTRKMTPYGRRATADLAAGLARARVTVVSGLARGVDTVAHHAALEAGGRTIAVLGSGVDVIYPPENRNLVRRIVDEGCGAVVSEYPPGTQPDAVNFPSRNRIVSGLAKGVLVVEADLRSGALLTKDRALEQDREVFAVPGSIYADESRGTNMMLKNGVAKCVTRVEDILEELKMGMVADHVEALMSLPDDPTERRLLEILAREADPQHIDTLAREAGLPVQQVGGILAMMELKGLVRQVGALQYVPAR